MGLDTPTLRRGCAAAARQHAKEENWRCVDGTQTCRTMSEGQRAEGAELLASVSKAASMAYTRAPASAPRHTDHRHQRQLASTIAQPAHSTHHTRHSPSRAPQHTTPAPPPRRGRLGLRPGTPQAVNAHMLAAPRRCCGNHTAGCPAPGGRARRPPSLPQHPRALRGRASARLAPRPQLGRPAAGPAPPSTHATRASSQHT
jgi:hypothetical protein